MKRCPGETKIDDYLLAHAFDCPSCFRTLEERDLLVRTIKAGGESLWAANRPESSRRPLRILKPWLAAGAVVLLVASAILGPRLLRKPVTWMPPTDDTVRGGGMALLSPSGLVSEPPAALAWKEAAPGFEYKATLEGPGMVWSGRTARTSIALPEDIRRLLRPDTDYRWHVQAFATQGYLAAVSETLTFRLAR